MRKNRHKDLNGQASPIKYDEYAYGKSEKDARQQIGEMEGGLGLVEMQHPPSELMGSEARVNMVR